jgi:hypothetical protein
LKYHLGSFAYTVLLYFLRNNEIPLPLLANYFLCSMKISFFYSSIHLFIHSFLTMQVMLCGDSSVNVHQIVSSLSFSDFPKKSGVPQWLAELLLTLSEDALRKFLVFVTGSPSLPASFAPSEVSYRLPGPAWHVCMYGWIVFG